MEARKVQLAGGATFTVSLPKPWAREQDVEAGSLLYLSSDDDGTLVVKPGEGKGAEWTATIDVTTYGSEQIRETIRASYIGGVDRITLVDRNGHDAHRRAVIADTVAELSGVDVFETTETQIVLRNLIDARNVSIAKNVVRLRLVALAMQRDAVTAVIRHDRTLAEQVIDRDREADRLFTLVMRYFRRSLADLRLVERIEESRPELFEFYYVARQCERIADHAGKMARIATQQSTPPDDTFAETYAELASRSWRIVDTASGVVLADADVETAYRTSITCDELVADVETAERELYTYESASEAHRYGVLLDSVKRTAEYGNNVAEMAIQREIRETMAQ
ncbi:PhoU domain-containing protein [Halomarina halobia]|uniref:PhoU domain-containing protein n=1 Tax=Halomarina halobia TaxID=3033386 RepID=A0ABD6A732_9EURY|nr:phosphate uptake regulator PhoU [Halomarina sp. PSR21]